jgi:hypothetical protein
MTGFIETLSQRHSLADTVAQATGSFLLQGAGGKRCTGVSGAWFLRYVDNFKASFSSGLQKVVSPVLGR